MTANHIQAPDLRPIKHIAPFHARFPCRKSLCIGEVCNKIVFVTRLPAIEAFGHFFFAVFAIPLGCEVY